MWTREELKANGQIAFRRNYAPSVLAALVLAFSIGTLGNSSSGSRTGIDLFSGESIGSIIARLALVLGLLIVTLVIGVVLKILLFNPLSVGCYRFFILNRTYETSPRELFFPFKSNYLNIVKTLFLRDIFLFLWTLLLIIPGIIKFYAYRMVPYILAENSNIDSFEAIKISESMMYGEKINVFILDLSFILWELLSAVTFGIAGVFYVNPYRFATEAELYAALKQKNYPGYEDNYRSY